MSFGIRISKETTPEIYKLVLNMREDAGDLATRAAKDHYMRIRPFAFFKEDTCNPEQQQETFNKWFLSIRSHCNWLGNSSCFGRD